jgi:hypothetical protein
MQSRQLSYEEEFTADIWHIRGTENIVAEALSCPIPAAFSVVATGSPAFVAAAAPGGHVLAAGRLRHLHQSA